MRRIRRMMSIFTLIIAFLLSSASIVLAEESNAMIKIDTIKVSEDVYRIDFSINNVTDMAGISVDMVYDNDTFNITDGEGNLVEKPIIEVTDLFNNQEGSFVAINKVTGNKITYVNMLLGVSQGGGVSFTDYKNFGSLFLEVKDGQIFNGFNIMKVTRNISAIDYDTVCVKISDSQAMPILYGLCQAEIESYITFNELDKTLLEGSYPVVVFVDYPDSTSKIVNMDVEMTVNQGVINIQLPSGFDAGTIIRVQFENYYSTKYILDAPTSHDDIHVSINLFAGDLTGDNKINDDDYNAFYTDFYTRVISNSHSDYNHDNYFDIFDLFYISKNFGKGGN